LAGLFGTRRGNSRDSFSGSSFPGSGVCRFQRRTRKTVISEQWSVVSFLAQTTVHFKPCAQLNTLLVAEA
jgi:hypothetical protein